MTNAEAGQRAAQYVRKSTEHQRYSIEAQKAAIGDYRTLKRFDDKR